MTPAKLKWPLLAMSGLAAGTLLHAWYFEKYFFEVKRFSIGSAAAERSVRIVLLTDLHFGHRYYAYHKKLAKKINALAPAMILVSGDLIDEDGQPQPLQRFLSQLHYGIPKFAIEGNHDHKNKVSRGRLKKILQQANGQLLINETVACLAGGVEFTITGVDDFIESEGRFGEAVQSVGKADHHLMLIHSPLQQEEIKKEMAIINAARTGDRQLNISYIFAGHNHGGQVRLGPLVPKLPEQSGSYINGWYNNEPPYLYVSKGFGTSCVPFRLGARPEITVFDYGVG